jgi:hypothetical protein
MDKSMLRNRFIHKKTSPIGGLLVHLLLWETDCIREGFTMSDFQLNATVAAKDLMRSKNPESLTLEELRELKKKCEAVLVEIWKLVELRKSASAPERANITARRFEMEMFIARIFDLINAHRAAIALLESSSPADSHHPNIF